MVSINSFIIGLIVCFGLFFAVIGGTIDSVGVNYDTTGYNDTELQSYNHLDSLNDRITSSSSEIESTNVDSGIFDWFAGLWSKIKAPFVFVIQSYNSLIDVTKQASSKLQLMPAFKTAITTIIVLIVVFGILAARYFMGRK